LEYQDQFYSNWEKKYEQLRKERDAFRYYFDKHRTCKCNIISCRHLQHTEKELEFKHRFWELHIQYMNMGVSSLLDSAPELFEKKTK